MSSPSWSIPPACDAACLGFQSAWRLFIVIVAFVCLAIEASANVTVTLSSDKTCVRPGETISFSLNVGGTVYSTVLYGISWSGGWMAIKGDNSVIAYHPYSNAQTYWTTGAYPSGIYRRSYTNSVSPAASFDPASAGTFGAWTFDYSTNLNHQTGTAVCYLGAEPISDDGTTRVWKNKTTAAYTVVITTDSWVTTEPDEDGNKETISYLSSTSSAPLLPGGTYVLSAWTDQPTGNGTLSNQSETAMLTMDTVAPGSPTNLTTSNHGANSFTLSWSASTDNFGVANYEVFRNGVSCGVTSATSLVIIGLDLTTLYSMTVRARDVSGNASVASVIKPVWLDITLPTQPGTPTFSAPYRVAWAASADNSFVTAYEILNNGVLLATSTTPWADLPSLLGVASQISVRARDTAGNRSVLSPTLILATQSAPASMALAAANSSPVHVTLVWKAAFDGFEAASYNIYEGTTFKGSTRELTFIDTAPSAPGNLTYRVKPVNATGVESTAEATAVVAVPAGYADDSDQDRIPDTVENLLGTGVGPVASFDTTNVLQVTLHRPN